MMRSILTKKDYIAARIEERRRRDGQLLKHAVSLTWYVGGQSAVSK